MGKVATEIAFLTSLGSYYDTAELLANPMDSWYNYVKIPLLADLFTRNVKFDEDGSAYVSNQSFVTFRKDINKSGGSRIYVIKESNQAINHLFNFIPVTKSKKTVMIMHAKKDRLARLHCIPYDLGRGIVMWHLKRW